MDVSPKQLVSVAAALIPFLEHDDANRALMGANMQKQAVPLLRSEAPLVGTGVEFRAAVDAGDVVLAEENGVVEDVSADQIVVKDARGQLHTYDLIKFRRSNQGTNVHQKPIVTAGDKVQKGQVIADGPSTEAGRDRARQEPGGRLHALGGPQLRGRDHPVRAARQGRRAHLDPHRGARGRRPRHQARAPRRSPATSRTSPRRS